jgi:hypothetical protein
MSTEYNQKLVYVSDSVLVPNPHTKKRAKLPKIHPYTEMECSWVMWLENLYDDLDESLNKQTVDTKKNAVRGELIASLGQKNMLTDIQCGNMATAEAMTVATG